MLQTIRHVSGAGPVGTVAIELVVVIVGILVAIQIDNWNNERKNRGEEREYRDRLLTDLRAEVAVMDDALHQAQDRIDAVNLIERVARDPGYVSGKANKPATALESASWRSYPQIAAFVYSELQTTGKRSLVRSHAKLSGLALYFARLQHDARVGTDLDLQHQFDRFTAGILTTAELIDIEQRQGVADGLVVSDPRRMEIARQLASRPQAIDLLPGIAQHNVFNLRVIRGARERAVELIAAIETELSGEN